MRLLLLFCLLQTYISSIHTVSADDLNAEVNRCNSVDSLNAIAFRSLRVSYLDALQQAGRAEEMAIATGCTAGEMESIIIKSYVWANTSKCRYALAQLDSLERVHHPASGSVIMGKLNSARAQCYYYLGDYDTSRYFYEKAIDIFTKSNMPEQLVVQYNKLAKVFLQTGNTRQAGLNNQKAGNIQLKFNTPEGAAWSQDVLGEIFQAQRLYEKALNAHLQSYEAFHKLNHLAGRASALLHTGNSHYMLVNDDSAKIYYNRALSAYQELGDSNGMAISYSNLSRATLEEGKYEQALEYANKTLSLIQGGEYKRIESATLQQLGDIYSEMKQYDKAIAYVKKALNIAFDIDHKVKIMDCYKSLSEIYAAAGMHDQSYIYLLRAYRLKDSIQPIAFSRQLGEMQEKYESKQKEIQIQVLKQSDRIKTLEIRKQNFIIVLTILIFTLIAIVVYFSIQKQKIKSDLEKARAIKLTEENERIRFAKDIHDELGSGLSKISFLSEIIVQQHKPQQETKQTAVSISETARGLIDNMRDLIWTLNPENTTFSTLLADIREYVSDYLEDFPAELVLVFPDKTDSRIISRECHREIMLTIKESLTNIVKHANADKIVIKADIIESEFCVSVADNGSGVSGENFSNGHGMKNMKSRMMATGGVFEFESSPMSGTTIQVRVPVSRMMVS